MSTYPWEFSNTQHRQYPVHSITALTVQSHQIIFNLIKLSTWRQTVDYDE